MKKLAFVFAAIVAVSFASCGQKTEQGSCNDSDSVECDVLTCEEEVCVDSTVCCDSVAAPEAE